MRSSGGGVEKPLAIDTRPKAKDESDGLASAPCSRPHTRGGGKFRMARDREHDLLAICWRARNCSMY